MISCHLRGRIGNQLFQTVTVIATALRNNTDYCFPSTSGKRHQFPFMLPWLPINDFVILPIYVEPHFGTYSPIPREKDLRLQGYFQSEKYFTDYRAEVIQALQLPKYDHRPGTVSIHVRRGDYLKLQHKYYIPTMDYFNQAMEWFGPVGWKFVIFTDDMHWCRQHFKGKQFEFNEELDPVNALCQLTSCEHHIGVNSSFSWWGAWLGSQAAKVIVPAKDQWYTDAYKSKLSTEDTIPARWTQLKYKA